MRGRSLLGRLAVMVLLVGLLAGWSAQAFSLVMTGACVASMDSMDMGPTDPMDNDNSGDDGDTADIPCKGVAPRCTNSLGCIVLVGLPQADFDAGNPGFANERHRGVIHDLVGLSLQPELSPPRRAA